MDPYLEDPEIWRGFHHHLAEEIMRALNPRLGPRYYADVEVTLAVEEVQISNSRAARTLIADGGVLERGKARSEGAPGAAVIPEAPVRRVVRMDPPVKLRAVHVRELYSDRLVTSIEILSPWNKRRGEGLEAYRRKRDLLLRSPVHLVEIDLLRGGERPGSELSVPPIESDYTSLVNRAGEGEVRTSEIWPITLAEPLPVLPVPLVASDPDVALELQTVLDVLYDAASYGRRVDYEAPVPPPPLTSEQESWVAATVGRRTGSES